MMLAQQERTAGPPTSGPAVYEDKWLAWDKLQHFTSCFAITALAYFALRKWKNLLPYSSYPVLASLLAGVLIGALKEIGDYLQWWHGGLSLKDFLADCGGSLFAAGMLHLLYHRGTSTPVRSVDLEAGLVYGKRILRNLELSSTVRANLKSAYKSLYGDPHNPK